jgi:hypothetical protein
MDLIYMDLDGVVHPARGERGPRGFQLHAPGHALFESLPSFEKAIALYLFIKIVLSTSWVQVYGFERTRDLLPASLQSRIIGATWQSRRLHVGDFADATRYAQIKRDVEFRGPEHWLAIDDDPLGWSENERDALVLVPSDLGLACTEAQTTLRSRLAARFP